MNVLLIAGGWSTEREVSLAGSAGVRVALESLGHKVTDHDPAESLENLAQAALDNDFAFIMLHGSPGEDGIIQALLDSLDRPYQGTGPVGSMLALNKAFAKMLFARAGLRTAPWQLLHGRPGEQWRPNPPWPLFIKANTGGSSLRMELVEAPAQLPKALDRLFAVDDAYLVEGAVSGVEITCGVLGELEGGEEIARALPPILIKPAAGKIFDHASKYSPGGAEEICPAPVSPRLTRRVQDMALTAHRVLGLSGYSRADFIVPDSEEPVLLEVNTLPGMTSTSLLPKEAAAIGLSFAQLVERLIDLGLARRRGEKRLCPRRYSDSG
ncbi:MAG: D-alanine--D-alanine ligase [Desulfovibrio sp.]|jgi:D-alanine-D-alanine ligase|nr:D-alanine--D-alanine ligase [Desulfovibrio sp.]